jgi:hypothetical protein
MLKCGIIYKLLSLNTGRFYIGSSYDLKHRLSIHNSPSNKCSSKQVIQDGNFITILLLFYIHNSIEELEKKEGEFIKQHISNQLCVNQRIPKGKKNKTLYKYSCKCGSSICNDKSAIDRHMKTEKHMYFERRQNRLI